VAARSSASIWSSLASDWCLAVEWAAQTALAHFAAQCVSDSHTVSDTVVARTAADAVARRVFVASVSVAEDAVTRSTAVAVDASVAVAAE